MNKTFRATEKTFGAKEIFPDPEVALRREDTL
jgi:hypothetical protein